MRVYLSLPITGYDIRQVKARAERAKKVLIKRGYDVVTPFDVCPEENKPYAYYMGRDIEALLSSDAVAFLPDWNKSKGCWLEFTATLVYKIRRIFLKDESV